MNFEQFIVLAKQMLNMYYEKKGQAEGELQIEVIVSSFSPDGRKGLIATNKSEAIFEVLVNLNEKKSYLNIYKPDIENAAAFDLTFSKKENE